MLWKIEDLYFKTNCTSVGTSFLVWRPQLDHSFCNWYSRLGQRLVERTGVVIHLLGKNNSLYYNWNCFNAGMKFCILILCDVCIFLYKGHYHLFRQGETWKGWGSSCFISRYHLHSENQGKEKNCYQNSSKKSQVRKTLENTKCPMWQGQRAHHVHLPDVKSFAVYIPNGPYFTPFDIRLGKIYCTVGQLWVRPTVLSHTFSIKRFTEPLPCECGFCL